MKEKRHGLTLAKSVAMDKTIARAHRIGKTAEDSLGEKETYRIAPKVTTSKSETMCACIRKNVMKNVR